MTVANPYQADPTRIGLGHCFDQQIWEETVQVIRDGGISQHDVIENFMLFLRRVNFAKFLTHMELFKHTITLPGSIVECGVFKGMSLLTFAKLMEIYCPGDTLKRVIGFDTFSGFVSLDPSDGLPDTRRGKVAGGWNSGQFKPSLEQLISITKRDSMIPRFHRVELVEGDVSKTVPEYVAANPGLRISLLHLDLDLYQPTLDALRALYPLVVSGGVILLDEYGMEGFPGETKAFDEYFAGKRPKLTKFPFISTPGGYFIKDE
ncbi:MAG: macrocin-O-methyltransferase [Acidimicrobiia bacterium]|nr:macrocin-O-methyltransferase [Acidimicrobiia bacterium]